MVVDRTQSNTREGDDSVPCPEAGGEPLRRIAGRNSTKADIVVYPHENGAMAVKDYRPRPFIVRHTLGRWLLRREARAYRAAVGIEGVPPFLGRLDRFRLATGWIEGRPLSSMYREKVDPEIFHRLESILDRLHARGIALGDLHHRDVLVSGEGSVHVVDLATAWVLGSRPGPLGRYLFQRFREQDRISLAKMRARFTGGSESDAIAAVGARAEGLHRRGRILKRLWNRLRGKRSG